MLDPPSVTGLPPGQLSGIALPGARGRKLFAFGAVLAVALSAFAGVGVALHLTRGHAPFPHFTLAAPFPSVTTGTSPHASTSAPGGTAHPSMMPAMTAPATPSPTMTTRPATAPSSATATPSPTPAQATLTVTYLTVSDSSNQVEGEVTVANTGYAAISGWRIAVALPEDQFTAVSANVSGSVSNHILLMQPATGADTVPARGRLSVFFTAYGMQTAPELCAFNNVTCG